MKQDFKERPLKGLKEKILKEKASDKELLSKGKRNASHFSDMRKWNIELEKLEREEISIKNTLKDLNIRISEVIHRREVMKSVSQIALKEPSDKKKIDFSLNKINQAVNRNRSEKRREYKQDY